jgi:PDZ domain-containing protein
MPPPLRRSLRRSWWKWSALGFGVVLAVVLLLASLVHTDKVAFRPGSATETTSRVVIDGAPSYPPSGSIFFLTVQVERLTWIEWLRTRFESHTVVYDTKTVFGQQSKQEAQQTNVQLMSQAKSAAELAALSHLGYDVFEHAGALVSAEPETGAPAAGLLHVNDLVVAIDGASITTRDQLVAAVRAKTPGATVSLTVQDVDDATKQRVVRIVTGSKVDDQTGQPVAVLGISVGDRLVVKDLPVKVTVDSGRVVGNSAGLAFTLAIIDDMTPGELTGGKKIAVTGTIDAAGNVGQVGGVAQKVVAARRAGAVAMIVPIEEVADATPNAGDMPVIGVHTLDEALHALTTLGGNGDEAAISK